MTLSLDQLRRAAKQLRKDYDAGQPAALARLRRHPPRADDAPLCHADYLHVIAQEQSFASWPALKLAAETQGLDRAARQQRLKIAVAHGQVQQVARLLAAEPDLHQGVLGLEIALFDREAVAEALWEDPRRAVLPLGPRLPLAHLCFSRMLQLWPEKEEDMLAIAALLRRHGAEVNGSVEAPGGPRLSMLYGALIHADNPVLARWLLAEGADPNDGESLYHALELGHSRGLEMLLAAGARPQGTNALLRALDFNDHFAVRLLLGAGAEVQERAAPLGPDHSRAGLPVLHHAARRNCDGEMIDLLLQAGADPDLRYDGVSAYGYAMVYGNAPLARAIEARGAPELTQDEKLLGAAARGEVPAQRYLDPARLPPAYRDLLGDLLHLPGKLPHLRALVALGLETDRPDARGITPLQRAGWEGLPEVLAFFLAQKPDLSHVNAFGGTLLTTIIHGSENCPQRRDRDHLGCLRLALEHGVALPRRAITLAGDPVVSDFLAEWGARFPGQLVEG